MILLGVAEQKDGSFVTSGLSDPDKFMKDFWNTINDSNKVSVNLLTEGSITICTEENGDKIIAIEVPRAERALRPVYINNNLMGTRKQECIGFQNRINVVFTLPENGKL